MGNPTLFADAAAPSAAGYAHSGALEEQWAAPPEDPSWLRGHEAWPASLEPSCLLALEKLSAAGLALSEAPDAPVFSLRFGGEVPRDGSCLFAAVAQAAGLADTAAELRHRCVKRVVADAGAGLLPPGVEASVQSLYSPDLVRRSQPWDVRLRAAHSHPLGLPHVPLAAQTKGWGVHWVQERRLVIKAVDLPAALQAIDELVATGMDRSRAAEVVYGERATPVNDVQSWAFLMACDGLGGSEFRAVVMRYCEEGLLDVEEDLAGASATFGDELALLGLTCDLRRPIHVVQAHGADAGLEDHALFFLPHFPLPYASTSGNAPIFLLMRGASWTANGGDHFEPLRATPAAGPPAYTL